MGPAPKASFTKRQPLAILGGVVTVLTGVVYAAPDLGIGLPETVVKVIALIALIAGGLGVHSKVTPVAAPRLPAGK
jgi:hypothetical protein